MNKVYGYQKCSTVMKARKYLEQHNIDFEFFDFVINKISRATLEKLIEKSYYDIDDFFNKKGVLYKQLQIKDKLSALGYEEKLNFLLVDGKLIKRPIIEINDKVLLGFKEEDIDNLIK